MELSEKIKEMNVAGYIVVEKTEEKHGEDKSLIVSVKDITYLTRDKITGHVKIYTQGKIGFTVSNTLTNVATQLKLASR